MTGWVIGGLRGVESWKKVRASICRGHEEKRHVNKGDG